MAKLRLETGEIIEVPDGIDEKQAQSYMEQARRLSAPPQTFGSKALSVLGSVAGGAWDSIKNAIPIKPNLSGKGNALGGYADTSNLMTPGLEQGPPIPTRPGGGIDWHAAQSMPVADPMADLRAIIGSFRKDPARAVGGALPFALSGGLTEAGVPNPFAIPGKLTDGVVKGAEGTADILTALFARDASPELASVRAKLLGKTINDKVEAAKALIDYQSGRPLPRPYVAPPPLTGSSLPPPGAAPTRVPPPPLRGSSLPPEAPPPAQVAPPPLRGSSLPPDVAAPAQVAPPPLRGSSLPPPTAPTSPVAPPPLRGSSLPPDVEPVAPTPPPRLRGSSLRDSTPPKAKRVAPPPLQGSSLYRQQVLEQMGIDATPGADGTTPPTPAGKAEGTSVQVPEGIHHQQTMSRLIEQGQNAIAKDVNVRNYLKRAGATKADFDKMTDAQHGEALKSASPPGMQRPYRLSDDYKARMRDTVRAFLPD